jgi:hypothetical protein
MVELEIDRDRRRVREVDALLAGEMIGRHSGALGTLCFVVRRPGALLLFLSRRNRRPGRAALTPLIRFLVLASPLVFFSFSRRQGDTFAASRP